MTEYFARLGAQELDKSIMDEYQAIMRDHVIPEIEREFQRNTQRAAKARLGTGGRK